MESPAACSRCRRSLHLKDWTCPFCGEIIDRYLFSTVTLKSLGTEGRNAYQSGYRDCLEQARNFHSTVIVMQRYRPTAGQETAYRAGWQMAANKRAAKADRKFGRRRGLILWGPEWPPWRSVSESL